MNPRHRSEVLVALPSLEDLTVILNIDFALGDTPGAVATCGRNNILVLFSRHVEQQLNVRLRSRKIQLRWRKLLDNGDALGHGIYVHAMQRRRALSLCWP